jgi:hypothetical protein
MHLSGHMPSDRSYGSAAQFLERLINDRKEDFTLSGSTNWSRHGKPSPRLLGQ